MRTLIDKYLGGLELGEDVYKVDLAVVDRYQSYSSELLRLSLLGIAGYGFLISNTILRSSKEPSQAGAATPDYIFQVLLPVGVTLLGLSAATALGHRYFSTDCITHFVRRLRLHKRLEALGELDPEADSISATIKSEKESLRKDLSRCRWLLLASSLSLVAGAAAVAAAFALIIAAPVP